LICKSHNLTYGNVINKILRKLTLNSIFYNLYSYKKKPLWLIIFFILKVTVPSNKAPHSQKKKNRYKVPYNTRAEKILHLDK